MFSKAKRFDPVQYKLNKEAKKAENEAQKIKCKVLAAPVAKSLTHSATKNKNTNYDTLSQCSSTQSVKSSKFVTPKPVKAFSVTKPKSSIKKPQPVSANSKLKDELVHAQEVEIRNKDITIAEYIQEIEELKTELYNIKNQIKGSFDDKTKNEINKINDQVAEITLEEKFKDVKLNNEVISDLKNTIHLMEQHCQGLEEELCSRQVELASVEDMIGIRDSLCKDLQNKLTDMETCLEETKQRLEMVKGHHALALEANESIRREYKIELESLKTKLEEEKQSIINKSKVDQELIKSKYLTNIQLLKDEHENDKKEIVSELQQQLLTKDSEMKAKLEQIDEATHEKLRLCEIQFEERCRNLHEHWTKQEENIKYLKKETRDLKYALNMAEDNNSHLQTEINNFKTKYNMVLDEKQMLIEKLDNLKDEYKRKEIDYQNEMNKLTANVEFIAKEKSKFELSLSVTRDIVNVLTMRLRESDSEIDHLEANLEGLTNSNKLLEDELLTYKNTYKNTVLECKEYKEALVSILQSKAALAIEHSRIMEQNVSLMESLKSVEQEAYRELGTIKSELIGDVELLKKESNVQIKKLKDEVERKRLVCEAAREHADLANTAAEQSRGLLTQAALTLSQLETDNLRLQQQIEDQQSLVVELSLLRQENEDLSLTVAKQSSLIEKIKFDAEKQNIKPKSPSVHKKTHKLGKENSQIILSPLRERNH